MVADLTKMFEFVVIGTPVSQQTRRRSRLRDWRRIVTTAATARWPAGRSPWDQPVKVTVTHFYAVVPIDLDNLAKPVLDAIKGIVITDDGQVCELVLRRIAVREVLRLPPPSPLIAGALVMASEFLHVLVVDPIGSSAER